MSAIRGRAGNRSIPVDEYPVGHMERINETLNAIAEEEDAPSARVLDVTLGPVAKALVIIAGLLLVTVVSAQAIIALSPDETAPPVMVTDLQLPTLGVEP